MKIGKLLDLTNDFMSNKKCWVFPCMIEAIAHAGGKTSDELVDELGIREAYEASVGIKKECGVSECTRKHRVSPSELGPGDWHEDHDYTFAPGSEGINRVSPSELGLGDWHEDHDYTFAPGSEGINRVSPSELGPGDWHEDHDYTFSGGA